MMIIISNASYKLHGCPNCGCSYGNCRDVIGGIGKVTCGECGEIYTVAYNGYENIVPHPRASIPAHEYMSPDIRPEYGEFWNPRGVGYDLSGFVKSKQAGERILEMVKNTLQIECPLSWLDYRPYEPEWIQFKFQKEEFNLEKLYEMAKENKNIITKEMLKMCKW